MAKGPGGIISGGFDPLNAPDAPTAATATPGLGEATVSVTAPEDTGGSAVSEYRFQIVDTSDNSDQSETSSTTSADVTLSSGTYKVRAVAFNNSGSSQPSAYSSNFDVFASLDVYGVGRNIFGELGLNDRIARSSPVQVGPSDPIKMVGGGGINNSWITTTGKLFSAGQGSFGKLGDNTIISRSSPVQIGALTNWEYVSRKPNTCAAIKTDGTLWTWGFNSKGELGQGDSAINRSSPVQVGSDTDWKQVEGGEGFFVSVKTDGTLWGWGANGAGELGLNETGDKNSPVQIGSDTDWSEIMGTLANDCFVKKTDGTVYAWGGNTWGYHGQDDTVARSSPIQLGFMTNALRVGTATRREGGYPGYSMHYITPDGELFFLGENQEGVSGIGTYAAFMGRSSPVQVGALSNWSKVATSGDFAHAIKTDGTLWAWGYNGYGVFGNNNRTSDTSPQQIGSDTDWFDLPLRQARGSVVLFKGVS